DGKAASAADLILSVDRGKLGAPRELAPGVFRVPFQAPDAAGGSAVIRAAVSHEGRGDSVSIALLPGPPARVRLRAVPAEVTGPGEVRLAAEVVDARGNPLPPDGLVLAADAGD